jgi:hypothetical protein
MENKTENGTTNEPAYVRPPGIYMQGKDGKEFRLNRFQRRQALKDAGKGKIRIARHTSTGAPKAGKPVPPSVGGLEPADGLKQASTAVNGEAV